MVPETMRVENDMEVFSSDGEKIGAVSHVWPDAGDSVSGITTSGYFQVDQGGILGLGAKHLYVPYAAVDDYVPGECVTLNCTKGECADLYQDQPDFLAQRT